MRYFTLLLCLMLFFSCGSKTRVILLPDEDGKTGSVVVRNQSSSTTLDKPYTYTNVSNDKSSISVEPIEKNKVAEEYQLLLDAEPAKPVYFILYFEHDSTKLTKKSQALIPKVFKAAEEREPSEISVIGHTDTMGSFEYNNKLALQRANIIAEILRKYNTILKNLDVKSHGENDPLVLTKDGISEGKNRRVEVMVR